MSRCGRASIIGKEAVGTCRGVIVTIATFASRAVKEGFKRRRNQARD